MRDSLAAVDIGHLLERGSWTPYQKFLTFLAALAVIFDGFDIQILGFAIPSIMKEWHMARAAFAPVLALGLAGMAVGSPLAGFCGDRWGRRTALIGCVTLFGAATVATALCNGLTCLAVLRFLTGMGAGGALPNAGALSAEFAPLRRRPLAVTFTLICVPLGGMLGGVVAARILPPYGWHAMYLVGGIAPLALVALFLAALPESPRFMARRPERWRALESLVARMGHPVPAGSSFEDSKERSATAKASLGALFAPALRRDTAGLWIAFFFSMTGIYLVFGWLPALLTAHGLDLAAASTGLAAYNFGGVFGVVIWAAFVTVAGSRGPMVGGAAACAASALALVFIPIHGMGDHFWLLAGLALQGLLANAVQTTMFAVAAHVYPTALRASGMATAASLGRVGAMLSSFVGAAVIQAGAGAYFVTIGASMAVCALGMALVKNHFEVAKTSRAADLGAAGASPSLRS